MYVRVENGRVGQAQPYRSCRTATAPAFLQLSSAQPPPHRRLPGTDCRNSRPRKVFSAPGQMRSQTSKYPRAIGSRMFPISKTLRAPCVCDDAAHGYRRYPVPWVYPAREIRQMRFGGAAGTGLEICLSGSG
eukprot:gene17101-biopygen17311